MKNESEKKERMLERAVVRLRLSWFWFNINLKAALGDINTVSFFTVSEIEGHLRALMIFIFSVCLTHCERSLVFDTCVYAVVMAAGRN